MNVKITIGGIPTLDGVYEFDPSFFTNRELHEIKRITDGVRANEIFDALKAGDNDIVVAFASIGLTRNGRFHDLDALWDAKIGQITLTVVGDEEGEAIPPVPGGNDSYDEPPAENSLSGFDSAMSSDLSPSLLPATGTPG